MRAAGGRQLFRKKWQQLGRAFTARFYSPSASREGITSVFSSSRRYEVVEQCGKPRKLLLLSKSFLSPLQGADHGDPILDPCRRHAKLRASDHRLGGRSCFWMSDSGYADPGSRGLYCLNPNYIRSLLHFKLIPGRTQSSNASSSEIEYWDPPEFQEERAVDQNAECAPRQDEGWDHDRDLERDDRSGGHENDHMKMSGNSAGVDWGQQHVRVREYDTRHRATVAPNPTSKYQRTDVYIPVKACYVSRSVDLKRLSEEPFLEITSSRNNLIIRFSNRAADAPPTSNRPGMAEISRSQEKYMVAFQYGSVVFFNFGDEEEEEALLAVRKFCTDEFRETRKDDYGVLVRPNLPEWSEGGQDQIMLRMLDKDNIRVISSVLGQSIALDHYAKKVDEMVNIFSELNRGMEKTGTFTMTRKSLFQLVAAANTTLADVILRLGLLERSDTAWKDANYAQIWEYLRDDFELDERFESLDFKLNIIQHNVRFFLEILQNRKSDTLEWIIIFLITGEICVSLYEILHTARVI